MLLCAVESWDVGPVIWPPSANSQTLPRRLQSRNDRLQVGVCLVQRFEVSRRGGVAQRGVDVGGEGRDVGGDGGDLVGEGGHENGSTDLEKDDDASGDEQGDLHLRIMRSVCDGC